MMKGSALLKTKAGVPPLGTAMGRPLVEQSPHEAKVQLPVGSWLEHSSMGRRWKHEYSVGSIASGQGWLRGIMG